MYDTITWGDIQRWEDGEGGGDELYLDGEHLAEMEAESEGGVLDYGLVGDLFKRDEPAETRERIERARARREGQAAVVAQGRNAYRWAAR